MAESPPVVSVVVPAYNAAATIGTTLESLRRQRFEDFEVVIVDDGSTDGTAKAVEPCLQDPRFRIVRRENGGLAQARNTGIEHARGELVAFVDADDLLLPSYLETMRELSLRHPEAGWFFTDAFVFEHGSGRVARNTAAKSLRPPPAEFIPPARLQEALFERNFVFVAVTIRRAALDRVGGFAVPISPVADWHMWLRLALAGYAAAQSPSPLGLYRRHAGQMSASRLRMERSIHEMWDLMATDADLPAAARERAKQEALNSAEVVASVTDGPAPAPRRLAGLRSVAGRYRHWRIRAPRAIASSFGPLDSFDSRFGQPTRQVPRTER